MSTAQERTLAQYQDLMQLNASAHLLRAAREIGLIDQLRAGQRTAEQLTESLGWAPPSAALMIDALLAIGVIERYGDDLALSRAGHLLCQYDQDLGDAHWSRLVEVVRGDQPRTEHDDQQQSDYLAATQWAHTAAAMQAAEILDVGQGGEYSGLRILDLGCGSAVWSCAIAHRDPESTVTVVDRAGALQAARSTADSIGLTERFEFHEADPLEAEIPGESFDLVLTAQRVSCLDRSSAESFLSKAAMAAKAGGRVVWIDLFRGPATPSLAETIEALRLELGTRGGHVRSLQQAQQDLRQAGLQQVQFTFLAASGVNLGLAVGVKAD